MVTFTSNPGADTQIHDLVTDEFEGLNRDEIHKQNRARGWPIVGCVVSYFVLAVLAFLPVGPFDTSHLPLAGPGNPAGNDPFQMTWFLAYVPYALTHGLSLFHTNFIDYPTGVNLADNTSVPLLGLLGWPITSTLGPVATFNFLIRLSFAVSGVSMFFVLRRWCLSWQAPFVGGLLYAFGPYMAAQELHLDLTFVPIPPLLVLFADELLRRQKMRAWLLGLLIGVAAAAQFLTSPDVLSGCVALAGIIGICLIIRFHKLVKQKLSYVLKVTAVAAVSFVAIGAYPIYEMLLGPGSIGGPVVRVGLLQAARADLLGAVVPTSNQLVYPTWISWMGNYFVGGNLSENGTYIGIPLLIVLYMIVRRQRRDATVMVFMWTAITAWVLSLGGHLVIGTWNSAVPLPGDIFEHLPLFNNTIPARYALYVALFSAMVLAIGLERMWLPLTATDHGYGRVFERGKLLVPRLRLYARSLFSREGTASLRTAAPRQLGRLLRSKRFQVIGIGAIVALSVLPAVPFSSESVPWPAALPSTIESVVPRGSVVLPVPFATPSSSEAMTWPALDHMDFRIVGGYANIADPGQAYGQRQPLPLPPSHVQEMFSLPKLGSLLPWVPPEEAESQLLTYLSKYKIGAIVFSAQGANTSEGYWYLIDTLGQPTIVRPGFAIWLPSHGRWPSRPVG